MIVLRAVTPDSSGPPLACWVLRVRPACPVLCHSRVLEGSVAFPESPTKLCYLSVGG